MKQLSEKAFGQLLESAFYFAEEQLTYKVTSDVQKFIYAEAYFCGRILEIAMYDALGQDFIIEVHEKSNPYLYFTLYNDNAYWYGHELSREEIIKKCIEKFA